MEFQDTKKAHRKAAAGPRAEKKKERDHKKRGIAKEFNNFKAFTVAHAGRKQRDQQRLLDRQHRRHHVQLVNRAPVAAPPPVTVVVQGPPGCGKSTLIRSLVKKWTKHSLTDIYGPITVVTGKNRRVTLVECSNDLNSMTDLAKVADLVLLMVDAKTGFEMETFEFLNILQTHGFPKVMGILTHLDHFKEGKKLKKTKKALKQRFWTEIYNGAKLFYLSGVINNKYLKKEIENLCRFVSIIKFRPLTWRNTHPYVLVDRYEDITSSEKVQSNPKCDRTLALFGFVRGTHLKPGMQVHMAGVGDYYMKSLSVLADPCPLPDKESELKKKRSLNAKETLLYAPMANVGNVTYDKDAIYIDLPNVQFTRPELLVKQDATKSSGDQDDSDDENSAGTRANGGGLQNEGVSLVRSLQDIEEGIDEKLQSTGMKLFKSSAPIHDVAEAEEESDDDSSDDESDGSDDEEAGNSDGEDTDSSDDEDGDVVMKPSKRVSEVREKKDRDDAVDSDGASSDYSDDESDNEGNLESGARWKSDLVTRAAESFKSRSGRVMNLTQMIYGEGWNQQQKKSQTKKADTSSSGNHRRRGLLSDSDDSDDDGDSDDSDFFTIRKKGDAAAGDSKAAPNGEDASSSSMAMDPDAYDCAFFLVSDIKLREWTDKEECEEIRNRFVTGNWGKDGDENGDGEGDDGPVYGDFEDLEEQEGDDDDDDEGSSGEESDDEDHGDETIEETRARLASEKAKAKTKFDDEYDDNKDSNKAKGKKNKNPNDDESDDEAYLKALNSVTEEQREINDAEFQDVDPELRVKYEGARAGCYVRVEIQGVPAEFVKYFHPKSPLILGGLQAHESGLALMRIRIKKHRWFPKILKSHDPLIFSIGWRRFQALPMYSMEDTNERQKYLKYTPEHMHCVASVWAPVTPTNTGILAFQNIRSKQKNFRISASGVVIELNQSCEVVKKLKLVGEPFKIFKNTAFIKGMFNTELEVARYEGAALKTVSGVRGMVKKAVRGEKGNFRATFEDKILMSDIVFCRAWVPVEPRKFYNPITSLLGPSQEEFVGMRTVAQLRYDNQVPIPVNKDSLYKPIERKERHFNALKIPKKIQAELPFASKPKQMSKAPKNALKSKVIMDAHERKVYTMIQQLNTIRNDKVKKRKLKSIEKRKEKEKKLAREAAKFAPQKREEKKRKYRAQGLAEKRAKV